MSDSTTRFRQRFEAEQRRRKAAALYLQGMTQHDIAERLEVAQTTVQRDIAVVRERWKQAGIHDLNERKCAELERVDWAEREAQRGWRRSLQDEVTVTREEGGENGTRTTVKRRGQSGNPAFLQTVLKCVDQRCRILGLNAPEKIDVTITDATEEELAERERQLGIERPRFTLPHVEQQSN